MKSVLLTIVVLVFFTSFNITSKKLYFGITQGYDKKKNAEVTFPRAIYANTEKEARAIFWKHLHENYKGIEFRYDKSVHDVWELRAENILR